MSAAARPALVCSDGSHRAEGAVRCARALLRPRPEVVVHVPRRRGAVAVLEEAHRRTSAFRLWRCVQVMRAVDRQLEARRKDLEGRARSVAVQGNRIALHLVLRELDMARIDEPDMDWDAQLALVSDATDGVLDLMIQRVEDEYSGNYITSLFKNARRCEHIVKLVGADRAAAAAAEA